MTTVAQQRQGVRKRTTRNVELISRRINLGLSRETLAHRAQIGRETIRLAELGVIVPTPRVQFALASAVGTTPLTLWPIEQQRSFR